MVGQNPQITLRSQEMMQRSSEIGGAATERGYAALGQGIGQGVQSMVGNFLQEKRAADEMQQHILDRQLGRAFTERRMAEITMKMQMAREMQEVQMRQMQLVITRTGIENQIAQSQESRTAEDSAQKRAGFEMMVGNVQRGPEGKAFTVGIDGERRPASAQEVKYWEEQREMKDAEMRAGTARDQAYADFYSQRAQGGAGSIFGQQEGGGGEPQEPPEVTQLREAIMQTFFAPEQSGKLAELLATASELHSAKVKEMTQGEILDSLMMYTMEMGRPDPVAYFHNVVLPEIDRKGSQIFNMIIGYGLSKRQ